MVIVNKKPPSKKFPLLLFQFQSPATWNNWLSHQLNLYSFVINFYSSSSPVLTISLCLLIFFFLLFFLFSFFFFSLTRPHEAEEWQPAAHFSLFQWPYRPESGCIGLFRRPESGRIKKKPNWRFGRRVGASPVRVRRP